MIKTFDIRVSYSAYGWVNGFKVDMDKINNSKELTDKIRDWFYEEKNNEIDQIKGDDFDIDSIHGYSKVINDSASELYHMTCDWDREQGKMKYKIHSGSDIILETYDHEESLKKFKEIVKDNEYYQ